MGKHTRVEQINSVGLSVSPTPADEAGPPVQRKANGDMGQGAPADLARHGTSGTGGPLPHLDQIQASFGHHDVSGVVDVLDGCLVVVVRE